MYLLLPVNSTTSLIESKLALVVNQRCNAYVGFRPHWTLSHFKVHSLCMFHCLQKISNESIKRKAPVCTVSLLEQNMRLKNGRLQGSRKWVPAFGEGWCIVLAPGYLQGFAGVGASRGRDITYNPSVQKHSVAELHSSIYTTNEAMYKFNKLVQAAIDIKDTQY